MKQRGSARIVSLFVSLALIGVFLLGVTHAQDIYDWYRLRNYSPPQMIAQLAAETTMNTYGRKLFYVNQPQLEDKVNFAQNCHTDEQTIVLGCYVQNKGIYLYNVTDPRLGGVEQVTSAHEMLHAAYDRLSANERKNVDAMTARAFAAVTDERVKQTVAQYRAKDASVVPNELHSILGTEVKDLPADLESYYRKYFEDRAKIVAYSEKYESEFTTRKDKIASYDKQLSVLKSQIETNESKLDAQNSSLSTQRQQLDRLLAQRNYTAYNAGVDSFNATVRAYNALIKTTQGQIDQYNQIVKLRNAIVIEEQDLAKSLDSRLTTQQTQ